MYLLGRARARAPLRDKATEAQKKKHSATKLFRFQLCMKVPNNAGSVNLV